MVCALGFWFVAYSFVDLLCFSFGVWCCMVVASFRGGVVLVAGWLGCVCDFLPLVGFGFDICLCMILRACWFSGWLLFSDFVLSGVLVCGVAVASVLGVWLMLSGWIIWCFWVDGYCEFRLGNFVVGMVVCFCCLGVLLVRA